MVASLQLSDMGANRELSAISIQPNPSLDGSGFISMEPSPITTKPTPSFDESSPGLELSLTSTFERNPSSDATSFTSIEPKPSSDTSLTSTSAEPTHKSVETNLRCAEHTASFRQCLTLTPATTNPEKSTKAPSQARKPSSLAIVSPPSLSRFLNLPPSPSKSKVPVNVSSGKHNPGCSSKNFSLASSNKLGTLRSILKCESRPDPRLTGLLRKLKPSFSTATPIHGSSPVSVSQVKKATGGFSHSLLIGQGMFSSVYDGTLKDGTRVAIKCDKKSLYNPKDSPEFQSNIRMLRNINHRNLIKFYGYLEHNESSIFILEYVPNGNLRQHLDGKYMGFGVRLDIAIDIARGLAYLHANQDQPIIHGRLQSSNILLSNNMRAIVSDYGFPPVAGVRIDYSSSNIILLSYCDPEFLSTFRLTEKSDVYSFGVVLVELLTGRPPLMGDPDSSDYVTTEWAKTMFDQGRGSVVLDPHIPRIPATMIVMEKMLALAVLCLNREGKSRPTMSFCAEALEQISEEYTLLLFGPQNKKR